MPAKPFRARITRHTSKLVLSLPQAEQLHFTIAGRWRDFAVDGPDPTVVTLRYRARKPNRSSESRLTHDTHRPILLPVGTYYAELIVTDPSPVTDLEVTVTPVPALPAHLRPHEWSYANKAKAEAAAWAA